MHIVRVIAVMSAFIFTFALARADDKGDKKEHPNFTNSIGMKFATIAPGEFTMGSPESEKGREAEETQHKVKLTHGFMMATTPVSQAQWRAVMGTTVTQQRDKQGADPKFPISGEGNAHPMYYVSWDEATEFCKKLSEKEGKHYRLPTEAEWEYACRAGTTTPYGGTGNLDEMGWYRANSGHSTHPVAQKKANAWGLYDMHGNISQWCSDGYGEYAGDATDPKGVEGSSSHVLRGGSCHKVPAFCRAAFRSDGKPDLRGGSVGFRLCLDQGSIAAQTTRADEKSDIQIRDLAGQWTIVYGNGPVHLYTIDKDGKMSGRVNDVKLTGQVAQKDGVLLLTFSEGNKQERLSRRADGRLVVEHWDPKGGFPSKPPSQVGVGTPATGKDAPGAEFLDVLMLECLEKIGCSAATLTVARGNQTFYSRGYGWSDDEHKVPILPDTPMCTASCDKPLTAAMIRQLAHAGKLNLNASVLKVLKIKPAGQVVDNRVWDITINHLLDHKAGWQGAPMDRAWQAANGHKYPIEAETLLSYVAAQRLSWTPGTKAEYDSFGYNTLKRVVAHVSGRSYIDYLRFDLCRPHGIAELKWVRHGAPQQGEPPQLWNGLIMEDPEEYRMAVSTPALCTFMRCFWLTGAARDNDKPTWWMNGSWDNATTSMIWRPDGINVAWSFNGRKDDASPGEFLAFKAIDMLLAGKMIPSK